MASTASSPSSAEIRKFQTRVNALIADAATAEDDTIGALRLELADAQADLRLIAASSDSYAAQIRRTEQRLATLEQVLNSLTATSIESAAYAGAGMIDSGLTAAGLTSGTVGADLAPLISDKTGFAQGLVTARVEDLNTRAALQLGRLAGGTDLQTVLGTIGEDLTGSPVFGRITADGDAMLRTALGDVQGAGAINRSQQLADLDDGPTFVKRWKQGGGANRRASHRQPVGQGAIPLHEDFRIGRYRTQRPRGPGLPGVERIGCKCQLEISITTG